MYLPINAAMEQGPQGLNGEIYARKFFQRGHVFIPDSRYVGMRNTTSTRNLSSNARLRGVIAVYIAIDNLVVSSLDFAATRSTALAHLRLRLYTWDANRKPWVRAINKCIPPLF
jgi:hypothetical protein